MLVLSRRPGEAVFIKCDDGRIIKLTALSVRGNTMRVGFDAPEGVEVFREELYEEQYGRQPNSDN